MQIFTTSSALQTAVAKQKQQGKRVGFAPTMGNLHAGHLSLVTTAQQSCDWVVASIFVNPLQFAANEDLDNYPRTLEQDTQALRAINCDALFFPDIHEIYPHGTQHTTTVSVPNITQRLCGASRPGHFDGVSTVVSKLFNIVMPDQAFFGEKDFQQLAVIKKLSNDLNFPIEITGVPIVRDTDKLALSSRNGYLSHTQRQLAPELYRVLHSCKTQIIGGERNYLELQEKLSSLLNDKGFIVDYFEICNPETLLPASQDETQIVILTAASLGNTRLIDNVTLILN